MQIEKAPISLDVKLLNSILSDLENIDKNPNLKFIQKTPIHMGVSENSYGEEGVQSEYDEYKMVYKINSRDGILVSFTYITDSYGGNANITKIEFGREVNKTIIEFQKL